MTDREINELVRTLELDLNKILQEFYHQAPINIPKIVWAAHTINQISRRTLNTAMLMNQDAIKEIT